MKLRTFTALLLAAIMLFALTACGSQAADDSSNDQQQEQHQGRQRSEQDFLHQLRLGLVSLDGEIFSWKGSELL